MKKLFSVILSVILIFSALPLGVFGLTASAAMENYYDYEISNGEATITYCSDYISGDIVIPSSLGGYPVTSIGYGVFRYNSSITSVVLPQGLKSIRYSAFDNCSALTSVTIPDSVTSIDDWAFCDCTSLNTINFPDSVTSLGASVFYNTGYYNNPNNWENDVLYIGNFLLEAKSSLSGSYTVKDGTISITSGAFRNCGISSIAIPVSVTNIGYAAFEECSALKTVYYYCGTEEDWNKISFDSNNWRLTDATRYYHNFGDWQIVVDPSCEAEGEKYRICHNCGERENGTVPSHNFSNGICTDCNMLSESKFTYNVSNGEATITRCDSTISGDIKIPSTLGGYPVTKIDSYVFRYNTSITSVVLPESIKSIGYEAFYNCTSLSKINLPENLTYLGSDAFSSTALTSIVIPDSLTDIESSCFKNCRNLKTVTLGKNIKTIRSSMFENCSALEEITIPESVTEIWFYAFRNCTSLKTVNMGENVRSIGDNAFTNCVSLKTLYIPGGVTTIDRLYEGCTSLESVIVSENNAVYSSVDGVLYNKQKTELVSCPIGKTDKIIMPDSVTAISEKALYNCAGVNEIVFSPNITDIGAKAFDGTGWFNSLSDGLVYINSILYKAKGNLSGKITVKDGTEIIAPYAFAEQQNITEVVIPNGVSIIEDFAFENCIALETVSVPDSVTFMGRGIVNNTAYYNNQPDGVIYLGRFAVLYKGTMSDVVEVKPGTLGIASYAFAYPSYNYSTFEKIVLPEGLKYVGVNAFYDFYFTGTINLPESLEILSSGSFRYGPVISGRIYLPNVKYVGGGSFWHCTRNLEEVIFGEKVEYIGSAVFGDCVMNNVYILNSEAVIEGIPFQVETSFTVHCYYNSTAKLYAQKRGYNYQIIRVAYDASGDGKVNAGDLVALRRYLMADEDISPDADCNADNQINILDMVRLKKHLVY